MVAFSLADYLFCFLLVVIPLVKSAADFEAENLLNPDLLELLKRNHPGRPYKRFKLSVVFNVPVSRMLLALSSNK